MRVGLAQLSSGGDIEANLRQAEAAINEAAEQGAQLVALPEVMHLRVGLSMAGRYRDAAEPVPGPTTDRFGRLAQSLDVAVLLGSISEISEHPAKVYNTSVLIGPDGTVAASYRKVHLFDVAVDDRNADRESDRYLAGSAVVTAELAGSLVGLTVCYDLRFPELFRALALEGAEIVFVPANFTRATGEAHWMTLLRARAIENGLFIVAPAQCGASPGGFEAFGHSAVIDPWGRVLYEADEQPGIAVLDLDLGEIDRVRAKLPVLEHRRPEVYRAGLSQ